MGSRDKTTPTLTTALIRANMSYVVATIFSSLAFLSLSISMANLSFSSSVSTAKLSCLLATTFSSLMYLSNTFSSPRINLLRVARRCFLWFSVFLLTRLILGLSFLSSVAEALLALSFPFLSERFFFVRAIAALAHSRNE